MRPACNKALRDTLYQLAFTTLGRVPWARGFYDKKRKAGKSHSAALRALSNKWVPILFAMWKSGSVYEEERIIAARAA